MSPPWVQPSRKRLRLSRLDHPPQPHHLPQSRPATALENNRHTGALVPKKCASESSKPLFEKRVPSRTCFFSPGGAIFCSMLLVRMGGSHDSDIPSQGVQSGSPNDRKRQP